MSFQVEYYLLLKVPFTLEYIGYFKYFQSSILSISSTFAEYFAQLSPQFNNSNIIRIEDIFIRHKCIYYWCASGSRMHSHVHWLDY